MSLLTIDKLTIEFGMLPVESQFRQQEVDIIA